MAVREDDDRALVDGLEIDKQAAPVKNAVDKYLLVPEFLKVRGLVKDHLDSFNFFVRKHIKEIVKANNLIIIKDHPDVYLRYIGVRIGEPSILTDGVNDYLDPQKCRLRDLTYAAPIFVKVEYKNGNCDTKPRVKTDVLLGKLPIMLKSCCCVLYGKEEKELIKYGECPLDPGGYFIIKGTEKVILMQEQLSKNRIIIDTDNKGCVQASVTSSTKIRKSRTVIKFERKKIYLYLNKFTGQVPIMIVLKAMGMESDQEIMEMIGNHKEYELAEIGNHKEYDKLAELLLPSIEDCEKHDIHTRHQALEFLRQKVQMDQYDTPSQEEDGVQYILKEIFLANIPVREDNYRPKCIYVVVMLRRMMEAIFDKNMMDDKDYMGNKRLELSGQMLALLFEDVFKSFNKMVSKDIEKLLNMPRRSSQIDISSKLKENSKFISDKLEISLSTGYFKFDRFGVDQKCMTQDVSRLSYIAALGCMTKIQPQFENSRKVNGPRALQPSQWGMLCPCDTPVGESCGLVKNLALLTHVTTDEEDEGPIISLCYNFELQHLESLSAEQVHSPNSYFIMINGLILGKCESVQKFVDSMRKLRRDGEIGEFVSISVNEKQGCIYIASDGGRLCRPLVIADKGVSRIKDHHMKELRDGVRTFQSFLKEGLIEYLDVNEEKNALIALYEENAKEGTTHIEIEPFTILGVCAGLIPYPHHNHSPRNTYQCAVGKQAMGNIAYNQLCRMDNLMYLLVYPQRPLLTTRTIELVSYDKLGAGQNASVAVMSYSGYDIKDAIVMNKSSLDRGFGRCIVMKKMTAVCHTSDRIIKPQRDGPDADIMQILDDDGIAAPGEFIQPFDIYLNKQSPIDTKSENSTSNTLKDSQYKSSKQSCKGTKGETHVLDRVALYSDRNYNLCIKFMIRHTLRPEVGDMFSSRHGQKGVCGTIIQQEDFPFCERGVCPDLIINPHGFVSGMTVGMMIELLGSKAGVSCGRFHYGTAFGEPSGHADKVEVISETLVKHGFSYNGKDFIYSGITGEPLQAYIYMGPIYYQKLKDMVLDKMHVRSNGPRNLITRQPTEGMRVGEMERDCLIAYGASMLLFERMMISSDSFEVQVCQKCGLLGYYHEKLQTGICSMCKNGESMSTMKLPYACKLLFQELQSMNIIPRLKLREAWT